MKPTKKSELSFGVLYIATGERYVQEARLSAKSLKTNSPGVPCALVTDQPLSDDAHLFDTLIISSLELTEGKNQWKHHLSYKSAGFALSPFQKTLFLDSDTFVVEDISEVFTMLDYFDLLVTKDMHDHDPLTLDGRIINGLTPYNTGVVGYSKSDQVDAFLSDWRKYNLAHLDEYRHDQLAFLQALSKHPLKSYCLHSHYNFRFVTNVGLLHLSRVKVIHGRTSYSNFELVAAEVNKYTDQRAWIAPFQRVLSWRDRPWKARVKAWFSGK